MTARETTQECLSDPEATVADGWCNHPGFRHRYGTKPTARETTLGALTAADLGKRVKVGIRFGASVVGPLWRVEHRPDGTRIVLGTDYEMVVTDEPDTPVTVYEKEEA
jgi:hypothetical protein